MFLWMDKYKFLQNIISVENIHYSSLLSNHIVKTSKWNTMVLLRCSVHRCCVNTSE
ncbi:hypothetical protein KSF78_0005702 [Schistosoma japonicum]|nr:hypothetical protein KSF78_0005702 [Schistosoma japonicum]